MRKTTTSAIFGLFLPLMAATSSGQVPTCYDTACRSLSEPIVTSVSKDGVAIDASGVDYEPVLNVTRVELEPLDVRIPKPPYGVTGAGQCLLRFSVEVDGRVSDLTVARCPDAYAVDIRESSEEWRYTPVLGTDGMPRRVRGVSMSLPWSSEQVSITTHERSVSNRDPSVAGGHRILSEE